MNLAQTQASFWRALYGEAVDPSFLAGPDRLAVYANMFLFRQADALRADFPETAQRLGAERFLEVVRDYVRAHPSEHPDLGQLGRRFPAFLAVACGELGDLPRLEWARCEVFFEREAEAIGVEEFSRTLRIRIVPALRLVGRTAIWRRGFEVQETELPAEESRALELSLQGASFDEICGAFADPAGAFEALQTWIGEGWLTSPGPPESPA